jgi:hypothetical protein
VTQEQQAFSVIIISARLMNRSDKQERSLLEHQMLIPLRHFLGIFFLLCSTTDQSFDPDMILASRPALLSAPDTHAHTTSDFS